MTTSRLRIQPLGDDHLDVVTAMNDAEVPRVSPLRVDGLTALLPLCDLAVVAVDDADAVAGFVLALAPGAPYGSVNYGWFATRGDDFLYVDRVVVAPTHRRQGVAGALYDAVEARARATGAGRVTCEVNVRPPNPASTAFHTRRGFVEVGQQETTGGTLTVAMLALNIT